MAKRKRGLGSSTADHKKMVSIEAQRAVKRAKETITEAEEDRCSNALGDLTQAAAFFGRALAHAGESGSEVALPIQQASTAVHTARDAVRSCYRRGKGR